MNGVQEALSSNLSTRTKTTENNAFSVVFLLRKFSVKFRYFEKLCAIADLLQTSQKPPLPGGFNYFAENR